MTTYAIYRSNTNEDTGTTVFYRVDDRTFETWGLASYFARQINDADVAEWGYVENVCYVAKVGNARQPARDPSKTPEQLWDEDFIPF